MPRPGPERPAEIDWLEEVFEGSARITARRMFGGWGIYADALFFALISEDRLWLKADAASDAEWDAAGCARLTFDFGEGKQAGSLNYRLAPDDTLDDPQAMRHWADLALAAAARSAAKAAGAKRR